MKTSVVFYRQELAGLLKRRSIHGPGIGEVGSR